MSADSHQEHSSQAPSDMHAAAPAKSSARRLILLTTIMLGFAAASFLPSLFSRGGTSIKAAGENSTFIFIPVWIALTIAVVVISMWFTKFLMEAEKYRDHEVVQPAPASAPHH